MTLYDTWYYLGESGPPPDPGPDQTVVVAPARRAAVAYGPRVVQEGVVVPAIRATVFRRSAPTTPIVELDQSFGRQWRDPNGDVGSAELMLDNDDPDLADVLDDDLIRFDFHGVAAMTMLVRQRHQQTVSEQEEHGQVTTLSGPGHLAVLDEGLVYPARGVGAWPIQVDRLFNWTAPDYDDGFWVPALALMLVDAAVTDWPSLPFADGFPAGSGAQVIWAPGTSSFTAPEGDCYFREDVTVTTTGHFVVFATIDNWGEVFIDGQSILQVAPDDGFAGVSTFVIDLTAGTHTVAVWAHNAADDLDPGWNPGAVAVAGYDADESGQPISTVPAFITGSSWKVLPYPATPPGMTPGEALRHAVEEAQARGALTGVTLAFTDTTDSAGNPWPIVGDIATKVGTDVLTFVRELTDTYIDVWMAPGGLQLYAWVKNSRGLTTTAEFHTPTDDTDPSTGNLVNLTHTRTV